MRRALVVCCKAVLLVEAGWIYAAIGHKLDMREQSMLEWRKRCLTDRLDGLAEADRAGVCRPGR